MSDGESKTRSITVKKLTRVEGEGGLDVRLRNGAIESVRLSIYEAPRFFEAFLRGRPIDDVPDITARICGICPIAYQMTSVHAIENALKIKITPLIRKLRRLLYCAEWIESHVLHIYMLNAPDFFHVDSGIELAKQFPEEVERGLRMKQIGNRILEVLGGRAIHPVNVRVGGFYRLPARDALLRLLPDLQWGLEASLATARWVAGFDFPVFDEPVELVALQHPEEYPMNEGHIASNRRQTIKVDDYESHFTESQVAHSTALHSTLDGDSNSYFLGPLARLTHNHNVLFPPARRLFDECGADWSLHNRFSSILARSIEVVHAFAEAIDSVRDYRPDATPCVAYSLCDGDGVAATEAPRGLIFHRYHVTREGEVAESKIVPPTSQNQRQIESDLCRYLPGLLGHEDSEIARQCEKLIRTYDPCISCSTHFLTLNWERIEG